MSRLDCLIVKPGSQKQLYGKLSDFQLTAIEPPLWAAILAGFLREKKYIVEILDAEIREQSWAETAVDIENFDPILTAIFVSGSNPSASTMNMIGVRDIISVAKQLDPHRKIVILGLHPSALPLRTMIEEDVDYVIQGEGFYTLPNLIDSIKKEGRCYITPGLWQRTCWRKISSTPRPELMKDLNQLPMPAWDLLPMHKYRAHNWHCFDNLSKRQPYAVLYTSLGCPFNCSFCCINALFGKHTIRYRSADKVVKELDFLVNTYGIRNIKIIDEMFALSERRVVELCDKIIERKYDLNMWAYGRVNTVTPRMLEKMKAAGINWIAYGFESGNQRVLDASNKNCSMSKADEVVRMTYNAGLYIGANFVFGLPGDDQDTMQDTLDMALIINAEWANFYCAMAYPGSELYILSLKNEWELPKTWGDYSQYSPTCLPLRTKHLSAREIVDFRDDAFHTYYSNPHYLSKIEKTFGVEAIEHVKKMSKHRIERRTK